MFFFLLCAVCERVKNLELKQVREVQDRPCSDPQNRCKAIMEPMFFSYQCRASSLNGDSLKPGDVGSAACK